MTDEANAMDFVGRVAMKWLQDYAENPQHGTYAEAIADLTALIIAGAVETATTAGNGNPGVSDSAQEFNDGREVPEAGVPFQRLPNHLSQPSADHGKGDSSATN